MYGLRPLGQMFNILTDNNMHTKASLVFLYLVSFSKPGRSDETIASFSTRSRCLVALRTALIDTAVDLRGVPAIANRIFA